MGGGVAGSFAVNAFGLRIGIKAEAFEPTDEVAFDLNCAVVGNLGVKLVLFLEPAHQRAGAPVDEALGQALVQRIRQTVLNGACAALPMLRIDQPIAAIGYEGPSTNVGNAIGERVDVAIGAVGKGDLVGETILGHGVRRGESEMV